MNVTEKESMISVIIPAYNAAQTLEKACESVLRQDYANVELIVVNDGSTDDTAKILNGLKERDERVRVVTQTNGGVCKARNTGMDCAGGGFIAFLDADDEMLPGSLTLLHGLLKEQGCAIAAGNFLRQYPDREAASRAYDYGGELLLWRGNAALENALKDHPATYTVWGKLYSREAIGQTRFVEGRKIHEDSYFIFELLLEQTDMAVTQTPVTRHYMTPHSASRTGFSDKFLDMLYFAKRKYAIIEERYPQYRELGCNVLIKASIALLNVMRSATDPKYTPVRRECIQIVHTNAKYFVPAIPRDLRMFRIIRLRLYWLYRLAARVYSKLR